MAEEVPFSQAVAQALTEDRKIWMATASLFCAECNEEYSPDPKDKACYRCPCGHGVRLGRKE